MSLKEGIHYKKISHAKYKYELLTDFEYLLDAFHVFENEYIKLSFNKIKLKQGYKWDGATGFPDTSGVMRASLVHDAFYQIIKEDSSLHNSHKFPLKDYADMLLKDICIEDGVHTTIAHAIYLAVQKCGVFFI